MLTLEAIEKRSGLTRETFKKDHLDPLKPVVFTDLMDNWAAKTEWTIDNLKRKYGYFKVPVVTPNYSKPGKGYMEPELYMRFDEYLTLMEGAPMPYRIFLWNIFRQAPEMINDFVLPTITDGFLKDFPYMFFGGQGSVTPMHFDLDLSHVFLNQLHGRKRIVLFSHEDSKRLYHHPYTVASYVDINKPDYEKFPALSKVKGWETVLNPGETVFIPTGFWHYIEYVDGGYSIALRANESYARRVRGAYQIAKHFVVDKSMNKILGPKWRAIKEDMAKRRAEELV